MLALTDTFGVAAAVSLRASSMGIALLSSLPSLLASLAQFFLPAWGDPSKGRKHYVLLGVGGQCLFLFLAGMAGWIPGGWAPMAYIACFVAASVSGNMTGPYWAAWMGDLMPGVRARPAFRLAQRLLFLDVPVLLAHGRNHQPPLRRAQRALAAFRLRVLGRRRPAHRLLVLPPAPTRTRPLGLAGSLRSVQVPARPRLHRLLHGHRPVPGRRRHVRPVLRGLVSARSTPVATCSWPSA